MKEHRVAFSPEAEAQLVALFRYIAAHSSPNIAQHFTGAIVARCEGLSEFPLVGRPREDMRPNLRVLACRRRAMIAYAVDPGAVTILGVFHGGQDAESLLRED
jgi:toxin ParE1/3/4